MVRFYAVIWSVLACGFCFMSARLLQIFINCDIGWLIYASSNLTDGKILYRDFFEVNPPLIFTLHFLANFLAGFTDIALPQAYIGLVLIIIFLIYILSIAIMRELLKSKFQSSLILIGLFIFFLILPIRNSVFTEREHLFVILITPYILSAYMTIISVKNPPYKIATFLTAIFALFLKPYFLIVFFAVEAAILLYNKTQIKSRLGLYILLLLCGLLYIACTWLFTPYFFSDILPMGLDTYYGHRHTNKEIAYRVFVGFTPIPFILLLLAFNENKINKGSSLLWHLLILAGGLLPLIQYKGWLYTYYPWSAFAFLATLVILIEINVFKIFIAVKRQFLGQRNKLKVKQSLLYILTFGAIWISIKSLNSPAHPPHLYLRFLPLHFFVLLGVFIKESKNFKRRISVYGAGFALLFLALYGLKQVSFTVLFTPSLDLAGLAVFILVISYLLTRNIRLTQNVKNNAIIIITISLTAFYTSILLTNIRAMYFEQKPDKAYLSLYNSIKSDANIKNIFIFNTTLYPAFPLVNYSGVKWGSRFHHLWMFPAIYEHASYTNPCKVEPEMLRRRDFVYNSLYADFQLSKPELLIFDVSPQLFLWKTDYYFNWQECIHKAHPALKDFISNNYHKAKTMDFCRNSLMNCAYEIYRRNN